MYHSKIILKKNCSSNNLKQINESKIYFKKKSITQSKINQKHKKINLNISNL